MTNFSNTYQQKTSKGKFLYLITHPGSWGKLLLIFRVKFRQWVVKPIVNFYYSLRAYDNQEAIRFLINQGSVVSFFDKYEKELEEAQNLENQCPVKLGGAGNLELIYQLTRHFKAEKVVETGVAYGWSSLAFLLAMQESGGSGVLISTDLPYSKETERYVGWVVPEKLRGGWTIIRKADQSALPEVLSKLSKIDIAHYDSDKSYHGRMFGYAKLWSSLKPGGLLISDDVGDNLAFLRFARDVSERPMIVKKNKGCVGVLIKPEGNNV